jgi:hypothetical protein
MAFLKNNRLLAVMLFSLLVLAWIGGSDTERILFWSIPVVLVLVGRAAVSLGRALVGAPLVILTAAQLMTLRAFWLTPEFTNRAEPPTPVFTVLSDNFRYFDLFSYHGRPHVIEIQLLEQLLFGAVLLFWIRLRARRDVASASSAETA